MKHIITTMTLVLLWGLSFGCAKKEKFHQTDLPNPASYQAHFHEIDSNNNGTVTWEEFKEYFPDGQREVFDALDLDGNQVLDHEEWHQFEQAHGAKHTGNTGAGSY
jgi:hypothetical protein